MVGPPGGLDMKEEDDEFFNHTSRYLLRNSHTIEPIARLSCERAIVDTYCIQNRTIRE